MKDIKSLFVPIFGLVFLLVSAIATSDDPIVFFRTPAGEINQKSKDDGKLMLQIAKQQGHVTLWLTSNFPFNVSMHDMTQEEIDAQQALVATEFAEVLDPLVASGDVWHPSEGPVIKGPGCAVRATSKGLKELLRDQRIIQIVAMEGKPN